MKKRLAFGWEIEVPTFVDVLLNESNKVAITIFNKQFGDIQTLLLQLSDEGVELISVPQIVESVGVSLDKQITIKFAQYIWEQLATE